MKANYHSTNNKDLVRRVLTQYVDKEFQAKGSLLRYLGMPSNEIRDIKEWKMYLKYCSAVEIDWNRRREMVCNINKDFPDLKYRILAGDIQEIIIKGKDGYGNKLEFPYDIVYLDFYGSLMDRELIRIQTINELIKKQRKYRFLFMLTLNYDKRKFNDSLINKEILNLKKKLERMNVENLDEVFSWYKRNEEYMLKTLVLYMLTMKAEAEGYKVHNYAPIKYIGCNSCKMITFIFKLEEDKSTVLTGNSDQTLLDIFNVQLKEVINGRVRQSSNQAPLINNI